MNHHLTAKRTRWRKQQNPHLYCCIPNCLYRTAEKTCPKHTSCESTVAFKVLSYEPVVSTNTKEWLADIESALDTL
jgi:hypothetical protein